MGRLREMEIFVRVVEARSFSAAARDLKLGQPAISKMIAALEDRLRVRLLVRSTRQLSPTEAARLSMSEHCVLSLKRTKLTLQLNERAQDWKGGSASAHL